MERKKLLANIRKGFDAYCKVVNKELQYIYEKDDVMHEFVIKIRKNNFMHLCGIEYINPDTKLPVSGKHFYDLVRKNKINPDYLKVKKDGTTIQKLKVIGELDTILTSKVKVLDGNYTFFKMAFERGLRTKKQIFALAVIVESNGCTVYVPLSLLDLKTDKAHALTKSYEIHCIYERTRENGEIVHYMSDNYKNKYL